ncbi:MAG: 4Fe-4S dicluster domain-containing protein, partial [Armatimonadetes bacterium]|nr:4Fe-4S dicluster domain-containing protein [Armatimonadota bacterium]
VAPMERKDAPAEFRELKEGDEPVIDGSKQMMPPKDYLLPRYEVLLKIDSKKGSGVTVETPMAESKPRVIMGIWLPDAQAIQVLDRVFLDQKFKDPYYAARRESLTLVAVMPASKRWSWFCNSVDDVETWKQNVDAIMYDLGDKYYVETQSAKGDEMCQGAFFSEPTEAETIARNQVWDLFAKCEPLPFAGKAMYENLAWDDPAWAEIAQKCIACGMCSYMCPSCSCFDIQDTVSGTCTERYRCRDTCQFEDFTLMGHGHNPRDNQLPRSRQRLLHKFKYQHEQFGVVGCTGCGRCVELCPVSVDIREVLSKTCSTEREEPAGTEG